MKQMKRVLAVMVMVAVLAEGLIVETATVKASEASAFSAVQKQYGSTYPMSAANEIKTARKNIFGQYSKVLGVSAKYFKSYKAARKASSTEEYVCVIYKASSKKNVKKIKKALKKYVSKEKSGNANYFSAKGKTLLNNAMVGSKGKYVYLFVLDTAKNRKAVNAFKKNV